MLEWYTRKEIANKLWISEQRVVKSKKVVRIKIKAIRNKSGYMYRYLLLSELNDVWLIKERVKKETW